MMSSQFIYIYPRDTSTLQGFLSFVNWKNIRCVLSAGHPLARLQRAATVVVELSLYSPMLDDLLFNASSWPRAFVPVSHAIYILSKICCNSKSMCYELWLHWLPCCRDPVFVFLLFGLFCCWVGSLKDEPGRPVSE